jgi:hypothetical protein
VEHQLPIKLQFQPYKQSQRMFNPKNYDAIKVKITRLYDAKLIRTCRYAEWVSNIVLMQKKNGKFIDFQDLNRATLKDEYLMPIADLLVDAAAGHKIIDFMDSNICRIQPDLHGRRGYFKNCLEMSRCYRFI